jgi:cardiolipin synthase A/B
MLKFPLVALVALALIAPSCGSPPPREQLISGAAQLPARDAPCTQPLEPALVRRAAPSEDQAHLVCRMDAIESAVTGRPLVAGNRVKLLVDGPATHAAQLAAIRRARHHVHLVTYILADGVVAEKYRDAMIERARAGVHVRVMYDSVGGLTLDPAYREALAKGGVEVHEYAPVNPLSGPRFWRVTQRNHRKILVVDGRVAFTGGINISDTYASASSGSGSSENGWRDTQIRITGPAVAEFQRLFVASWSQEEGPFQDDGHYWPRVPPTGSELVRAVAKEGEDASALVTNPFVSWARRVHFDRKQNAIYASYLAAITESRQRVWITQAYFAPNDEFRNALEQAARRGVDVRLLVPANSDVGLMFHASRHQYRELLEAGVRIFEYEGPVLHAKTAVVDGVWSTVGSSNLDYMSFIHNDEANATIIGHSFAREMERMYHDDLANASEVTLEAWRQRPLTDRVKQTLANGLKYWI